MMTLAHAAAGAAIGGVDTIVQSRATRVMALVRPPGHHAERGIAIGFDECMVVARAQALRQSMGKGHIVIHYHHCRHCPTCNVQQVIMPPPSSADRRRSRTAAVGRKLEVIPRADPDE